MEPAPILICECNSFDCVGRLPLHPEEYNKARALGREAAVVLPGHQDPEDRILQNNSDYLVVEGPERR